jgi:hypothetical protein
MSLTTQPSSNAAGSLVVYSSKKWWELGIRLPAFLTVTGVCTLGGGHNFVLEFAFIFVMYIKLKKYNSKGKTNHLINVPL